MACCIGECGEEVFFYDGGWYLKASSPLLLREHYKYLEHGECKLNGLCVGTACKRRQWSAKQGLSVKMLLKPCSLGRLFGL